MNSQRGFTLIELLVVVAIVGLLASVVVSSVNGARAKGRNARRKSDLAALRVALASYYTEHGQYPQTPGVYYSSDASDPFNGNNAGDWIPGLAPTFIAALPNDPQGGVSSNPTCAPIGFHRTYDYWSNGQEYKLIAHCGPEGVWTASDPFYDPVRPTWAWQICDGAICSNSAI